MKVKVVLGLAKRSDAQVLIDGDKYTTSMTGNDHFTEASVVEQVNTAKDAVTDLRTAKNAPVSSTKTDNIRIARDALDRALTTLGARVEEVANNPSIPDAQRVEIVHSAGMDAKDQVHPSKHRFTVRDTEISGTVHLTATGGANAHEWQYTADAINFTGRISVRSTTKAKTDIANLQKGVEYAFFHKATIPNVETDWEGPIVWMVG
jgi:hypothetical protein